MFSRLALKQFCALLEGVAVTEISPGELESAIWDKIQAGKPVETVLKVPYPLIKKSLRKSKLELPYMPDIINYNIGCTALKVSGGLYLPCCGKCEEESSFCGPCAKHESKYGVLEDRGDVGTYSDPTDKHEISFGTWLAKNEKTIEEVYESLQLEGFILTIPSHHLTVNSKRFAKDVKARKGRPKAAKKEVTGDDSDSGSDSESETEKAKKPKAKAKKAKSPKNSDGESDGEKAKKPKAKAKKAKSSDGESDGEKTKKPKAKAKKAKSSDGESDEEKPEKKEKSKKVKPEPEKKKKDKKSNSDGESDGEKPKKEKKSKGEKTETEKPKKEKKPKGEKTETEKPKKSKSSDGESDGEKPKKSKSPKNSDGESEGENTEKRSKKEKKSKGEKKAEVTDISNRFAATTELVAEEYDGDSGSQESLGSGEEIFINQTKYMLHNGTHISDATTGEIVGTMNEDGEAVLHNEEKNGEDF